MIAQYWRIRRKDAGAEEFSLYLQEVQFRNQSAVNINSQATITGTGNFANALDGVTGTYWSASTVWAGDGWTPTGQEFIKFAFPTPVDIGSVYVDHYYNSPAKLVIEFSTDNNVWFTIAQDFTSTNAARSIAIPATPPVVGTGHGFWAIRFLSLSVPTTDATVTEVYLKDTTGTLLNTASWHDLATRGRSTSPVRAALSDGSRATSYTIVGSQNLQTLAGLSLGGQTFNGTDIYEAGIFWSGAASIVETMYLDCLLGASKPKSFVLSYCDAYDSNPWTGWSELFNWVDVLCVDNISDWTNPFMVTGLATGNPHISVPPPAVYFDKAAGAYISGTNVTVTGSEAGTIYYTTDGSTPTVASTVYTAPISLTVDITLQAILVTAGNGTSAVASAAYTVDSLAPTVIFPNSAAGVGSVVPNGTIALSLSETGTIYYTTDGSTPTVASAVYSTPIAGITSGTKTIKAIGKDTVGNISAVFTCVYYPRPTLTFSITPGSTVPGCSLKINSDWNYTGIYYTTDGSTPTTSSPQYNSSNGIPLLPGQTPTIKAWGYDTYYNSNNKSLTIEGQFTVAVGAPFWRFTAINAYNSGTAIQLQNMEFHDVINGANIVTPENIIAVSGTTVTTGQAIGINLFTSGSGYAATLPWPAAVTVQFNSPRDIKEFVFDVSNYPTVNTWPYSCKMEASLDGTTYYQVYTSGMIGLTTSYSAYGAYGRATLPVQILGAPDVFPPAIVFSKVSGAYPPNTQITLTATESATIRYTTDGSTPTGASPTYSSTLTLTADTVLKAIAIDYANPANTSQVFVRNYTVQRAWKYWRYNMLSTSTRAINNIEFYETPTGDNIVTAANSAIVTSTAVPLSGTAPSLNTFNSVSGYAATFTGPMTINVEFPTPREVVDVKINAGTNSSYWPYYYSIDVSLDGVTWTTAMTLNSSDFDWQEWGPKGVHCRRVMPFTGDTTKPVLSFSNPDGIYSGAAPLTISATKRCKIRYTTDGSTPSSGSTYAQPLSTNRNLTLKAYGIDLSGNVADIISGAFEFKPLYKYWRFQFSQNWSGSASNIAIRKLEMRSVMDGPNIVTTASGATVACTGIAGITLNNFENPAAAVSYSTTTAYVTVTFATPVEVREVLFDVVGLSNANYRPKVWALQCSTDNVTWVTDMSYDMTNSITYQTSYIQAAAGTFGTPRVSAQYPSGKYLPNTVFKFETNQPGKYLVLTTNGTTPTLTDNYGNYSAPTVQYNSAGYSYGGGIKVLKVLAYNGQFSGYYVPQSAVATYTYEMDTVPATVAFDKTDGEYTVNTLVTLTPNETASIYYTTNGTVPTVASTLYAGPIDIGTGMRIRAITKDSFNNVSGIFEGNFSTPGTAPFVSFSSLAGDYLTGTAVTLTATSPSTIYYTLDGTMPTEASAVYSTPLTLNVAKTITAFAKSTSTLLAGPVAAMAYTVDTIMPHRFWRCRINKVYSTGYGYTQIYGFEFRETVGGACIITTGNIANFSNTPAYNGTQVSVTYNTTSPGNIVEMFSNQSPTVTVEFAIPKKVKEIKFKNSTSNTNEWPDAFTVEWSDDGAAWTSTCWYSYFDYTSDWGGSSATLIRPVLAVPAPANAISWITAPGTVNSGTSWAINLNGNRRFIYTSDGTAPTFENGLVTHGTIYNIGATGFPVYSTTRIRVIAITASGGVSNELDGTFTVDQTAPVLTYTPANFGTYPNNQAVTITADEPCTIYYTTNGSSPTTSSTVYTGPIVLHVNTNIRFMARDPYGNQTSTYNTWFYIDAVAPILTVGRVAGAYKKNTLMTYSINEAGSIRYTTDGSTPTGSSTLYMAPGIPLVQDMTIKAVAWDNYNNMTTVASTAYTIERVPPVILFATAVGTYYADLLKIYINVSETANIYYTIDGSTPTTASTLYTGEIRITSTKTIKAIAMDESDNLSTVLTGTYVLFNSVQIKPTRTDDTALIPSLDLAPGTFIVPTDTNQMFATDNYKHTDAISELHIGSEQPLAKTKIWQDPGTGVMKYNNGKEWVAFKSPTTPKDFGTFS